MFVYLIYSNNDSKKNIPLVSNPMTNDDEKPIKPQTETTDQTSITEGPHMISDSVRANEQPSDSISQPLLPPDTSDKLKLLDPPDDYDKIRPVKVRYIFRYCMYIY